MLIQSIGGFPCPRTGHVTSARPSSTPSRWRTSPAPELWLAPRLTLTPAPACKPPPTHCSVRFRYSEEELRIKDARMKRLSAQRRPHYPPVERLAILELRAARAWSQAETARRLFVTPLTVASWTQRLDDEGPDALVQVREPMNRFPELVG